MGKMLKIGIAASSLMVCGSYAELVYSQPFIGDASGDHPMLDYGWETLNETTTGLVENATFTNKSAIANGRGNGSASVVAEIDAVSPGFSISQRGYPYFATADPELDLYPTDSFCLTYTTISTVLGIDEVGKLSVEQRADGTDSVIRFAVKIGTNWYASAENFGGNGGDDDGSNNTWALKEMEPADFAAAANWLEVSFGATDIIVGAAPASDLSGDVAAYGLLLNTGVDPNPGDHVRVDNFQVYDTVALPSNDLIYSQPFYKSSGLASVTNWGWTTLVESISGVVENPSYESNPTTVEAISTGTGGLDVGAFNAVYPTNAVVGNGGYGFFAPKQVADYAGAAALMYTVIPTNTTVAGLQQLRVDQNNDNTDSVIRFAIQIGSQWYVSAENFGGQNPTSVYLVKEMEESDFSDANKWLELTVTPGAAGEITVGSTPGAALSGAISAYGLYLDAGTTPLAGDHVRFDNFQVYGTGSTVPPGGTEPYIVSFDPMGATSSLSFTGGVSEAYIILSATVLGDGFSTTVTPVSVSVGGLAGDVITTDGSGDATAEITSGEDQAFYIVETAQ